MASTFACWSSLTIVSDGSLVEGAGCAVDLEREAGVGADGEREEREDKGEDGEDEDEVVAFPEAAAADL